jgi:hypothetical protein
MPFLVLPYEPIAFGLPDDIESQKTTQVEYADS